MNRQINAPISQYIVAIMSWFFLPWYIALMITIWVVDIRFKN